MKKILLIFTCFFAANAFAGEDDGFTSANILGTLNTLSKMAHPPVKVQTWINGARKFYAFPLTYDVVQAQVLDYRVPEDKERLAEILSWPENRCVATALQSLHRVLSRHGRHYERLIGLMDARYPGRPWATTSIDFAIEATFWNQQRAISRKLHATGSYPAIVEDIKAIDVYQEPLRKFAIHGGASYQADHWNKFTSMEVIRNERTQKEEGIYFHTSLQTWEVDWYKEALRDRGVEFSYEGVLGPACQFTTYSLSFLLGVRSDLIKADAAFMPPLMDPAHSRARAGRDALDVDAVEAVLNQAFDGIEMAELLPASQGHGRPFAAGPVDVTLGDGR